MKKSEAAAPPAITVVTTGGTIDKLYFDALSEYQVGESVVRKLLAIGNVRYPFEIIEALRKDSLELTDADRDDLYRRVAALPTSRVVMTHGTDSMAVTAARPRVPTQFPQAVSPPCHGYAHAQRCYIIGAIIFNRDASGPYRTHRRLRPP